jgi:CheY-like chemotaxis protein
MVGPSIGVAMWDLDNRTMNDLAVGGPRILVVEDNAELCEMLARLLGDSGYQVDLAGDGQAGLHQALTRGYDVLLIDRGLPGIGGFDLISRWTSSSRNWPNHSQPPGKDGCILRSSTTTPSLAKKSPRPTTRPTRPPSRGDCPAPAGRYQTSVRRAVVSRRRVRTGCPKSVA